MADLPEGIEAGFRLSPNTPLPPGWEILIKDEWWSAHKRSGPDDGMNGHPLPTGYAYPQHVRPIEAEKVCKHLAPGEVCTLNNLQCQAPSCMVPVGVVIDGRLHAPQPDGTCSGCNGVFTEFLDRMEGRGA